MTQNLICGELWRKCTVSDRLCLSGSVGGGVGKYEGRSRGCGGSVEKCVVV